jgi:hypothetical protein
VEHFVVALAKPNPNSPLGQITEIGLLDVQGICNAHSSTSTHHDSTVMKVDGVALV